MALYLSLMMPDQALQDCLFAKAVTLYAANLARKRSHPAHASHPNVSVTFMLPGRFDVPPFQGMQLTDFNKTTDTVEVRIAVPRNVLSTELVERYVVAYLGDAVEAALEYFREKQRPFDAKVYWGLVEEVERELVWSRTLEQRATVPAALLS